MEELLNNTQHPKSHLDTELKELKGTMISMWQTVIDQFEKSEEAIKNFDKETAKMINASEKRVDAFELKLSMDCENILALFNPVAIDLRFIMAVMKITYNLERIGDYAKSIGSLTEEIYGQFDKKLLRESKTFDMFKIASSMLNDALYAFENEEANIVHSIFRRDEELDKINRQADKIIGEWIVKNPKGVQDGLNLLAIIHKLERVGDQVKNISLEIIFHLEAKILRHTKKSKLLQAFEEEEKIRKQQFEQNSGGGDKTS
jgi:phosphate transport system protein